MNISLVIIAPWCINESDDKLDLFIDSEIDQPFCADAPLSLVSKNLGTTEVREAVVAR